MGIQGLLPLLNSITNTTHVSSYKNKKVAIDVYCWLHKGVYSCSMELCLEKPTTRYVDYCLKRLKLLQDFGVIPVVVFDGGPLPMKSKTEVGRRKNREESKAKGLQYLKEGNSEAALECFQKAVDITPQMAHNLIKALQRENIDYVVAPYEADAQLAFLSLGGHVDCIITEDSDLIAYGCNKILFKMDKDGYGKEICLNNLSSIQKPSFANFTQSMLRQLCILSGCDYVSSISGLGIKTAHSLIKKHRTVDRVFQALKSSRTHDIPSNYEELFYKAELTFLHQRVFDHTKNQVLPLTPFPADLDIENTDFLGPPLSQEIAIQIAVGLVDPIHKKPYTSLANEKYSEATKTENFVVHNIEAEDNISSKVMKRSLSLPVQKNNISSYFANHSQKSKPFVPPRTKSLVKDEKEEVREVYHSNIKINKKQKTEHDNIGVLLVPDSPERVQKSYKIISKYFKNDNGLTKSDNILNTNFSSPLINNNSRLSLSKNNYTETLKYEEEEEIAIKSDTEEEAIKSDEE